MKNELKKQTKKMTSYIAIIAMTFTQVIPAGFAGSQTTLTNELGQPVQGIAVVEAENSEPVPFDTAQGAHENFFDDSAINAIVDDVIEEEPVVVEPTPVEPPAPDLTEHDATQQSFWHDVHMDGLKDILDITEDDILSLTVTQAELDEIHAICQGPGCARNYDLKLTLTDGRGFDVVVRYSWDHQWSISVSDHEGNLVDSRHGDDSVSIIDIDAEIPKIIITDEERNETKVQYVDVEGNIVRIDTYDGIHTPEELETLEPKSTQVVLIDGSVLKIDYEQNTTTRETKVTGEVSSRIIYRGTFFSFEELEGVEPFQEIWFEGNILILIDHEENKTIVVKNFPEGGNETTQYEFVLTDQNADEVITVEDLEIKLAHQELRKAEIREAVLTDLEEAMGLRRSKLEEAIESIDVNLETGTVTITFRQGQSMGQNRMINVMGDARVPHAVVVTLTEGVITGAEWIWEGLYEIGIESHDYDRTLPLIARVRYEEGRIQSVNWGHNLPEGRFRFISNTEIYTYDGDELIISTYDNTNHEYRYFLSLHPRGEYRLNRLEVLDAHFIKTQVTTFEYALTGIRNRIAGVDGFGTELFTAEFSRGFWELKTNSGHVGTYLDQTLARLLAAFYDQVEIPVVTSYELGFVDAMHIEFRGDRTFTVTYQGETYESTTSHPYVNFTLPNGVEIGLSFDKDGFVRQLSTGNTFEWPYDVATFSNDGTGVLQVSKIERLETWEWDKRKLIYEAEEGVEAWIELQENGLFKVTYEDPKIAEMRDMVLVELEATMGLTREELRTLIDTIQVDLEKRTVDITFKEGKMGDTRLIDVLGDGNLPTEAHYGLHEGKVSSGKLVWPNHEDRYPLELFAANIYYENGKIARVVWNNEARVPACAKGPGPICLIAIPAPIKLHIDTYEHLDGKIVITRVQHGGPIDYLKEEVDAVELTTKPAKWEVQTLTKMGDGKFYLTELVEHRFGEASVTTKFTYLSTAPIETCPPCAVDEHGNPIGNCECYTSPGTVGLVGMDRSDEEGNQLSTAFITGATAKVTILNGNSEHRVEFTSLGDLLEQVRALEQEITTYYEMLAEFDEFMSGILREGILLEDVLAMRLELDELKAFIESLMEDEFGGIDELIREYEVRVAALNQQISKQPLLVVIGERVIEVNISEAMRIISEEYVRMRTEDSIEYERLPGIDLIDVEDLETFAEYLAATQIGVDTNMPMFKQLSSLGHLVLIERLLQKYGDKIVGVDSDQDGAHEVNFAIFRRMVNGTQEVYEAALALIEEIKAEVGLVFPTQRPVSFTELKRIAETITSLNQRLKEETAVLIDDATIEEVFRAQMRGEINREIQLHHIHQVNSLYNWLRNVPTEIQTIIAKHNIQFPSESTMSYEAFVALVASVDALRADLEESLNDFLDGLEVDSRVKSSLLSTFESKLRTYSGSESYYKIYRQLTHVIHNKGIIFTIGDREITVSQSDFNAVTGSLPLSIESLLQFPGIREVLTKEELKGLESNRTDNIRTNVNLRGRTFGDNDYLSVIGVRIQLMQKLLEAYGDSVLTDGFVDQDRFRRKLLMSRELEESFDKAEAAIFEAIARVARIAEATNGSLTAEEYQLLYRILEETNNAVSKILAGKVDNIIAEARNMISAMLNEKFVVLVGDVDKIVNTSKLSVTIGGTEILVDPKAVMNDVNLIVQAVAISFNGIFNNEQLSRLNGIAANLLKNLRTQQELNRIRTVNLRTGVIAYNSETLNEVSANLEYWFRLVPSILEALGTDILVDGEISHEKIQEKLFENTEAPVEAGENLLNAFRRLLNEMISKGISDLNDFDFGIWEERLAAEDYAFDFIKKLQAAARELIGPLSDREISQLMSLANHGRHGENTSDMKDFWYHFNQKMGVRTVKVTMPDGQVIEVNLDQIGNIPGFPRSTHYDKELFPGLEEGDFEGAVKRSRINLHFSNKNIVRPEPHTVFDQERFVINVIKRIYGELHEIPELYRENLFVDQSGEFMTVNVEQLRRILKGVDILHRDVLAHATGLVDEWLEKIEALKTVPMTTAQIREIQAAIRELQAKIIGYMNDLTQRHEKQDVIEIEEDITAVYKQVIDSMLDYIRSNPLVYVHNGVEVVIPTAELSERILDVIKEKFPDEEMGAHHFASFFGISIEDVRRYDKLEMFLGMQIIALPRNSQYVEILSKLSEIGMMELMEDAVARYADDVISGNPPVVNAELLVDLLTDPEVAVARALEKADRFIEDLMTQIGEIDLPLTSESFAKLKAFTDQGKIDFIQTMNDFVAGFTQEMFDKVQEHVRQLFQEFIAFRNEFVLSAPIQITAQDGSTFEIVLAEMEEPVVERIMMLLMQQGHLGGPDEVTQEEEDYLDSLEETEEPKEVDSESVIFTAPTTVLRLDHSVYIGSYLSGMTQPVRRPTIKQPIVIDPIWYPLPHKFDPEATLTEFGFYTLLVRLAEKYGNYVVDETGEFDLDRFLAELNRTDRERAEERFNELKEETLEQLKALLPQPETEAITLEDVDKVHAFIDEAREKFLKVMNIYRGDNPYGDPVISAANSAWHAVMNEYEKQLWNRNITVDLGDQKVTVDGKTLINIIREEYNKQNTEVIDQYVEGGEQNHEYYSYRTLFQNHYYRHHDEQNVEVGEIADDAFENSRYPFNLGLLQQLKGITSKDLAGLDIESKDQLKLTLIDDLREQLRGMLNMRVFAPGAQIQTVGLSSMPQAQKMVQTSGMMTSMAAESVTFSSQVQADSRMISSGSMLVAEPIMIDWYYPYPRRKYLQLSERDLLFRVLPAILKDYKDLVVNAAGEVDLEKFRAAVAGDYDLPEGGLEQIAESLGVNVDDILEISAEKRDFKGCQFTGCATWSRYVSVWVNVNGEKKHFAGVVTGGEYEQPTIHPWYVPHYVDAEVSFVSGVELKTSVMIEKKQILGPEVALIETDPILDGRAVEEIAKAAKTEIQNLESVDVRNIQDGIVCIKAPCPEWMADLKVTIAESGSESKTLVGTIVKYSENESEKIYEVKLHEKVEVVYKSSFGDASLVIEQQGEALTLRIRDEDGNELVSFKVKSYEEANGYSSRWFKQTRLNVETVDGKSIVFRSLNYQFRHRTWSYAYYNVSETLELEGIGTAQKSTTVRLLNGELKTSAESIYVVETRTFGDREFTFRRSLQHQYWIYDREGNEKSSYLSRRTKDGSSVTVRKTRDADGSFKHDVRVYKRGEGIVVKKTVSSMFINKDSKTGLINALIWKNTSSSGQAVIIGPETLTVHEWALADPSPVLGPLTLESIYKSTVFEDTQLAPAQPVQ